MSNVEEPKETVPVPKAANGTEKKEEKEHDVDYADDETKGIVSN